MKSILRSVRVFAGLAVLSLVAGCGGSSTAPPAITVAVSPATGAAASMVAGATQNFTATVTNDSTNAGVTWAISSGGGTLSNVTATGVTYTAASPVTGSSAVIVATSKTSVSSSASVSITLTPVAVTIPTTPTAIAGGATEAITASVSGDTVLNQGVTWAITSGGGSLTSVTTTSVTYNAPLPVTAANAVITATSKTDTSKTATITIPLTAISVGAISPATVSLGVGQSQTFTGATVSNDSSNSGVTWSISPASGAGTINASTGAYTAPTTVISATSTVTVTATSVKDSSKSSTAAITLQPIAVAAVTPATASLAGGVTQQFGGAAVTYDGTSSGVTWSVTPSTGAGTISSSGLYTAPAVVGSTTSATITATSVKDPTKSGTVATVTLLPIVVSFGSTTTATLDASQQYSGEVATISNDPSNSGVTLAVAAGGGDIGISSTTSTLISGAGPFNPIYFTPTTVPSSTTTTITATSVKDPTRSATFTVTLNPALAWTTPSSNTATLTAATTNTTYTYTLATSGGTGTKSYTVVSGALPTGLSLSTAGVISGTVTGAAGTYVAGVRATDQSSNPSILNGTFTIVVSAAPLVFNTPTLATGTNGTAYSQTLTATGGTGALTYSVTSGALPTGLSIVGNQITGTPTLNTAVGGTPLTFKVTDSATPTPATQTTGSVNLIVNPVPLVITSTSLPTGSVGTAYSYQLASTGGTAGVNWSLTAGSLTGTGLTLSTSGLLSGTPLITETALSLTFQAQDNAINQQQTKTAVLPLTVTTNPSISGTVSEVNNCGVTVLPVAITMTLSQSGTVIQTVSTNVSTGNYTFANVPAGTYTITPSIAGVSSNFYPGTQSVTVSASNLTNNNFSGTLGYTVSGTVTYSGGLTGRIYLDLNSSCGSSSVPGTSISSGTATYTIHGVPPGSYNLTAYMDNLGKGSQNTSNPTGANPAVSVVASNVTTANITLSNPSATTLTSAPSLNPVSGFNNGAIVPYSPITNSSNVEMATSYTLQWSTSSTFATVTGSQTFAATGAGGTNIWFLNSVTNPTVVNGAVLYFRVEGTAGSSTSPFSSIVGPVTIGAPTGGVAVSGAVTYTGTATGPLYVGFYNTTTGVFYGEYFPSPASAQAFTISVPIASSYYFVSVVDQNNDGELDVGDITNTQNLKTTTAITGATTGMNLTLPSANAGTTLTTQNIKSTSSSGSSESYGLNFQIYSQLKLPVAVTLQASASASGATVLIPADIGICTNCGGSGFQYYVNLAGTAPTVGDTYTLNVTYSDGTTGLLTPSVSAVLSAFATGLSPSLTSSTSLTPTFTWTYPANAANYTYSFNICCGSSGTIWRIPGNNSNSNGFTSSQIPMPAGIAWGNDPTGGGSAPNPSGGLTLGTTYNWQIQTQDTNGNTATQSVNYTP